MWVGKKTATRVSLESYKALNEAIYSCLSELSFEKYRYLQEFSEVAQWLVSELCNKISVDRDELLNGVGAPEGNYQLLIKDLEFIAAHALDARDRQKDGLLSAWLPFHATAGLSSLLFALTYARFVCRDFKLAEDHSLFVLCDEAAKIIDTLVEFAEGEISFYQATERLARM